MPIQLYDLLLRQADCRPDAPALAQKGVSVALSYQALVAQTAAAARGLVSLSLQAGDRVAVYLPKQSETVCGLFAATVAGGVMVPVNSILKPEQVGHILRDCNVRVLVTSVERAKLLGETLAQCPDLVAVVLVDGAAVELPKQLQVVGWSELLDCSDAALPERGIDMDMAAILYTSGSTGRPKGVVLSHRNMLVGATSVASYLGNHSDDRILSVLPLSFDAGLSQLTTAFAVGAKVFLLEYLLPRDVIRTAERESITGMTGVPPLWVQLAQLNWPEAVQRSLRYIANTGGHMPRQTLDALRQRLPRTQPFLMYGLTEAFRSTYLPPSELDRRPDSIGKAIPNAEIMVVREDGSACAPGEVGELVHRGSLVSLGYWNDAEKTAERFKPAPGQPAGLVNPELAVWSGDNVRLDDDGFIYFVGRRDDMIKSSGYRISPTEVEEVVYASGLVAEVAAIGVPHALVGQAVVAVVKPKQPFDAAAVMAHCQQELPNFMVPAQIVTRDSLPRNPNGKLDRKTLVNEQAELFVKEGA